MLRTKGAVSLVLGIAALALAGPMTVPAQGAAIRSEPAAARPVLGPQCPEKAPEGAVFVRRVQPPFGLGYDVYLLPSGQTVNIYC